MSNDQVQKRKEADDKPKKLFTINAIVYCDGNIAGQLIEYVTFGRMKNQKVLYTGAEAGKDFLSVVRGLVPSSIPHIEELVTTIEKDSAIEDTIETEKIAKVIIDIFSDSVVTSDFAEIVKGQRGAPKAWRKTAQEFISRLQYSVGCVGETLKPLIDAGSGHITTIEHTSEEDDA